MPTPGFELLAISDRATLGEERLPAWLAALATAGVGAVQIREKDLSDRALLRLALEARSLLPALVRLLVNGRLDVALAAGADGAHLPADGLPVASLRQRFGPEPLLGLSTHLPDEVARAAAEGADYVTFGPIHAVPGKDGPLPGLAGLRRAAAHGIPVYALGGVTLEGLDAAGRRAALEEIAAAGAAGIAGIRIFQRTSELPDLVHTAAEVFRRSRP